MAFVKGQPKTPGSGRRKKKRNELTADIKAAFRLHGEECVTAIMKLTRSKDERVRLGALQTALDRGFGKPTQHLEAQVSVYDSLGLEKQQALLAALEEMDASTPALIDPGDITYDPEAETVEHEGLVVPLAVKAAEDKE